MKKLKILLLRWLLENELIEATQKRHDQTQKMLKNDPNATFLFYHYDSIRQFILRVTDQL